MQQRLNEILEEIKVEKNKWKLKALHEEKASILEKLKPSTKELIICFEESEVAFVPTGFTNIEAIIDAMQTVPVLVERRSILEYNAVQRHPIPYVIVKYQNKYFFIIREGNSGEIRLIGKMGMLGGHVGEEDIGVINKDVDLFKTIENGLYRELMEEAGITSEMIESIHLEGLIKLSGGVEDDHLGFVYMVELRTDDIQSQEEGVIKGLWVEKEDLPSIKDKLENWSQVVYKEILQKK
ncbi:NUDIX domain-containing protein [Bacillus cereus group sp. BfR-BA-01328]|uniref:NUDIX domain-containing protein n=1 Tax=Bacillus cereus group sp. BfR-BA-01328 TaxID=2920304 RepID=UPI001F5A054D